MKSARIIPPDKPGGQAFIVGPEDVALRIADALDNPDLQIAFVEGAPHAYVITELAMGQALGLPFPVVVLPASMRDLWRADEKERGEPGLPEYTGELPSGV